MMPNIDPRTMRNLMAKMGIKSSEVDAIRVVIESPGASIIIENPQVTRIETQGVVSFQVTGDVKEVQKVAEQVNISEDDINLVSERTGITDKSLIKEKLAENKGDIAQTILDLSD